MSRLLIIFSLLLSLSFNSLLSQPGIRAIFTETVPVIDGLINDDVWRTAPVINDLYQREPNTGAAASKKSEFYFLYDHHNVYVGVRCYDDPKDITSKELSRDGDLGDEDRIQIIFDTYLDGRSGYWFQIGPRGSIGDAIINENGKEFNKSWDGLWDGRAKLTDYGWEGELIIPFKTMGFKQGNDTWGLKIIRYIKRSSEISTWPATSLNANRFQISDAGHLTGISNITQGIGLDIVPYITGGFSKKQDAERQPVLSGGGDIFYNITPSLKAAVTINTDFAQTEVDEKQINLTRFNLFFPEKRDFFLDGSNYFTFGINGDGENPQSTANIPFFSRRIGLDTEGSPVQIKYGGKFTGKADGWNFGMLHVKDDNQWDNPGYTVARVSRDLGKQSSLGIIGTNGNALSSGANSLAGFDLRLASSEVAGNKNITYNIYGIKSFTDSLDGRDVSFGTEISYPNDFLNFRVGYLQIGENYTAGLGFVPRKNIRDFYGGVGLGPRPKNSPVMQVKTGVKYAFISDLHNGGLETAQIDITYSDVIFLSGDKITLSSQYIFESLENDFNIFGAYTIVADDYNFWRHSVQVTSARRRLFWLSTKVAAGGFYSGSRTDWQVQAGYKVAVPLYIGVESDRKWVNLPDGDFIAQIYRINLNFMFSPNLTWHNFAQYENLNETIGWQSRFQWIIKPGKELFLTFNSPLIDPFERYRAGVYEARAKVKYTIRF
jgi:hypothetical protein